MFYIEYLEIFRIHSNDNYSVYLIEGIPYFFYSDFLFQYEMKEKKSKSFFPSILFLFYPLYKKKRNGVLFLAIYIFLFFNRRGLV